MSHSPHYYNSTQNGNVNLALNILKTLIVKQ